jgi:hypothetical protein
MSTIIHERYYGLEQFNGNSSRVLSEETWSFPDGRYYNPIGPAVISYHANGRVSCWCYYNLLGQRHRLYGPAREYFDDTGKLVGYEWWVSDELHNLNGPARGYFEDGKIYDEGYFIRGVMISKDDFEFESKKHLKE